MSHAAALTMGVEEEFLLVDRDGHLSPLGPELVRRAADQEGELQQELARCQVETATAVCGRAEEVLEQLRGLRGELAARAAARGLRLIPTATPVLAERDTPALTPTKRYQRMAEHFGAVTSTGFTCGCHVHVAMPDRATGVGISNYLRAWLPLLLAVTANSPFNYGEDTKYCSWRHVLWARWPSAGPPPLFSSLDHYEHSVEIMLRSEAMLDRGMIYWDIRLSEHAPTLEFRICDVARTAEEAALAAALVRALVATAMDDLAAGAAPLPLPHEVLRANLWRAARDGLAGCCLHPVSGELTPTLVQLGQLVHTLTPVLRDMGDLDFVRATVAVLDRSGGGAQHQRVSFERRRRLEDVVDDLAVAQP